MVRKTFEVNDSSWRKFLGVCKIKNLKPKEELTRIIDDFVEKVTNSI